MVYWIRFFGKIGLLRDALEADWVLLGVGHF